MLLVLAGEQAKEKHHNIIFSPIALISFLFFPSQAILAHISTD